MDELTKVVSNIRNALSINHQQKGQEVHVFDFSNTKGNIIKPPSISFDLSNYNENPFIVNKHYDLKQIMSDTIEDLSVVFPTLLNARFDECYSKQPDKVPKRFLKP